MYPSMAQTFGEEVETVIQLTDMQSINEPLVKPQTVKFLIELKRRICQRLAIRKIIWPVYLVFLPGGNVSIVGG